MTDDAPHKHDNQPPIEDRLGIDHEALIEKVADYLSRARDTVPTEVTSDEEVEIVTKFVKEARELVKEADAAKAAEKRPHLDANTAIEAFFRALLDRLMKGRDVIEKRGERYLQAKAAEEKARREEAARVAREEADRRDREARAAEEAGREVQADIARVHAQEAAQRAAVLDDAARDSAADMGRARGGAGTATLRTTTDFEIVDIGKIPLAQLRPHLAKADLEKAIRGFMKAGGRELKGVRFFEKHGASFR